MKSFMEQRFAEMVGFPKLTKDQVRILTSMATTFGGTNYAMACSSVERRKYRALEKKGLMIGHSLTKWGVTPEVKQAAHRLETERKAVRALCTYIAVLRDIPNAEQAYKRLEREIFVLSAELENAQNARVRAVKRLEKARRRRFRLVK